MRPIPGRGDCLEAVEGDGIFVGLGAEFGRSRVKEGSISVSLSMEIGYAMERRWARDVEAASNSFSRQP